MQGQWSRDDPSFFILLCGLLAGTYTISHDIIIIPPHPLSDVVTSIFFSMWMSLSAWGYVLALLWAVIGDGLVTALIVATVMWYVSIILSYTMCILLLHIQGWSKIWTKEIRI